MRRSTRFLRLLAGLTPLLVQIAPAASRIEIAPITFSPPLMAQLHDNFGDDEIPALQQLVSAAVDKALGSTACGKAVGVQIEIENAAPTRPTRSQMQKDPSIDFVHSKSVGGADLTGRLIGADGQVVATVPFRRYAPDIRTISAAAESWADARLAIDQFADKLSAACRAQEAARGARP